MREFKFRVWNHITKEMETGKSVLMDFYQFVSSYDHTLMQYTGLLDRNGKEIYEGDIVSRYRGEKIKADIYQVKWVMYSNNDECPVSGFLIFGAEYSEVIGNIWETPELLK